ncbi:UDP-glucuronosyltransferase [Clostridium sp. C8-1-8]|uniref:UDP-glucuronosyltransferase n=1 Tax=Clostridium sp. C8-1-8 TaxID=2698831 RepID=UPI00136DA8F0|nr:UDP-glucuronosyltransferase [Clostridium sp. C8-1-8]
MNKKVMILCSGFGLGFYVPGLLMNYGFNSKDVESEVLVFENYVVKEKRDNILSSKAAYHENFKAALLAQRMPWDIRKSLDMEKVDKLLNSWKEKGIDDFIVLSGHWIFLLEEYKRRNPSTLINAQIIYIDCEPSPSWKSLKKYISNYSKDYCEMFLFNYDEKRIQYNIGIENNDIVTFDDRENRLMLHGGGWGMGNYRDKIPELKEKDFQLDIIAYREDEADYSGFGNRYFMMDPKWTAWGEEGRKAVFPPFGQLKANEETMFLTKEQYHPSFDLVRKCKAMISKPGGGTLIDSLNACTPIILLEPFGDHEKKNMELWEELGFGISYENWKKTDFDLEVLRKLHVKLALQRLSNKDYITEYIKRRG